MSSRSTPASPTAADRWAAATEPHVVTRRIGVSEPTTDIHIIDPKPEAATVEDARIEELLRSAKSFESALDEVTERSVAQRPRPSTTELPELDPADLICL